MSQSIAPPDKSEYAGDFAHYIEKVPTGNLIEVLETQLGEVLALLRPLSDQQALVRHPPYTWSIKQVVGHMTDCERVFGYRTMRLARNDSTPLPTFNENEFARHAESDRVPFAELLDEFELLRRSHLLMLRHIPPDAWLRRGTVSGQPMTARAMAYAIAGHAQHHLEILKKRLDGGTQ